MNYKKIGLGLAITLVVFFLIGFLLPRKHQIVQQSHIVAAPKMVFAFIGDLKRWNEWTTWAKKDPNMQIQVSAPSYNIGASQSWKSESMGEGKVQVTQWVPEDVISYDLIMEGFPTAHASLKMTPQPQGAMVTWTFDYQTGKGSIDRWFGMLMRLFLNKDLSEGLENLRKLCESSVAAEIKAPWQELPPPKENQDEKSAGKKVEPANAKMLPMNNGAPAVLPMPGRQQPVPRNIKTH